MGREIAFQYEAAANASYLVASVAQDQFVRYEMKMQENNTIPHLLAAKNFQQDDVIQIYYNVTSKVSLQQILTRQQMQKVEFLTLLEGILSVYDELDEYQLSQGGILLDENYIFLKPGNFDPNFVFLPIHTEKTGLENLQKFVMQMVLDSRIANTNDDFIQRLIGLTNEPSLTIQRMHSEIQGLRSARSVDPVQNKTPELVVPTFSNLPQVKGNEERRQVQEQQPAKGGAAEEKKAKSIQPVKQPPMRKKEQQTAQKSEKATKNDKKRTLFFAIQGVFVIMVALLLKNGFFMQNGQLQYSYIVGVLLLILGTDVVLYRELFVNHKGKPATRPEKKPAKANAISAKKPPKTYTAAETSATVQKHEQTPETQPTHIPKVDVVPPIIPTPPLPMNDEQGDDTVVIDERESVGGCLEYVENGLIKRIHLGEGTTRIGSRSQSVDYVIESKKVSKMHAELTNCGGQYTIRDLNSTNGTYLNGGTQRIVSNQDFQLRNGDKIRMGDVELTFIC